MMKVVVVLAVVAAVVCTTEAAGLPKVAVDRSRITVSGLSAGGFFGVQFHVAFSQNISGAGILAGGPYYCSQGELAVAETTCMNFPLGIQIESLITKTQEFASAGKIDDPSNLANDKVWLYSGTKDTVVKSGAMTKLATYYKHFVTKGSITAEFTKPSEHTFPTVNYGNLCGHLGSPYISKCDYDAAGTMLQQVLGPLKPPSNPGSASVAQFDQSSYAAIDSHLLPTGYVYVPPACSGGGNTTCLLHVSFHGCEQSSQFIDGKYALNTGFLPWAEANNIVVVFPMVSKVLGKNPNGCYDWWGYTNRDFAVKAGPQMASVMKMIEAIVL